jgi:hypothetical protein
LVTLEQFDQALESGETSRTVKMLSNFHRAINLRFFEVDRTIKEFCSELSRLGKPLNDLQLELVKGL